MFTLENFFIYFYVMSNFAWLTWYIYAFPLYIMQNLLEFLSSLLIQTLLKIISNKKSPTLSSQPKPPTGWTYTHMVNIYAHQTHVNVPLSQTYSSITFLLPLRSLLFYEGVEYSSGCNSKKNHVILYPPTLALSHEIELIKYNPGWINEL